MKKFGLILALVLCAAWVFAYDYTNNELGFTARLPDGLTNMPSSLGQKYLVSLVNLRPTKADPLVEVITLGDAGSLIAQESPLTNASANRSRPDPAWKGLDLQVTREVKMFHDLPIVKLNVQVPLKPHAIDLSVSGQVSDEVQLRGHLDTILASIEGPTNWVTTAESGRGPGPNLICIFVGLIALLAGSLRLSPHYGLADSDARIAGFFILAIGLGLPYLDRVFPIAGHLHQLGFTHAATLALLVGLNFLIIIGVTVMLVCIQGNLYAKDANPLAYVAPVKKSTKAEKKAASAPPDTTCPLCRKPVSSKQTTCPHCHADLARWRNRAVATE